MGTYPHKKQDTPTLPPAVDFARRTPVSDIYVTSDCSQLSTDQLRFMKKNNYTQGIVALWYRIPQYMWFDTGDRGRTDTPSTGTGF